MGGGLANVSMLTDDLGGMPDLLESREVRDVKLSACTIGERPVIS